MKSKSYMGESIECYIIIVIIMILFFGTIVISGIITGNEWWAMFPDFSWDMFNTWDEIKKGNGS